MAPVLPGGTIGILGGGQLGRMTALAARPLGYHVHVLDPEADCAARPIADETITAAFDDADAAADLAARCDVVTLEIEKIGLDALRAAARHAPTRPGADVLHIVQDRGRQKRWLARHGFPLGAWSEASSADELRDAVATLGPAFAKRCHGGYDGRGQSELASPDEAARAWAEIGEAPCVVERRLDLEAELSVMVARRPGGEMATFPVALNHHERRILDWSVIPGPVPPEIARRADEIGRAVAEQLALEGIVAIELFLTRDGALLVNELAPRPHNSFHATERACITSQFEQHVRAVCDLPLGATDVLRPAAIVNLLGDLWRGDAPPAFDRALAIPGVRVHLYGKKGARPGRKMGHLSATGATPEEAVASAKHAAAELGRARNEERGSAA
jgi:5-(carboxyamino)imidazole ribonucleotide synthase